MSPAGAGVEAFRRYTNKPLACMVLTIIALAGLVLLIPGGQPSAHASVAVTPVPPGWSSFQSACTSGPSPGQGSTPTACVCWETNLQAVAIGPGYALDVLDAAQVGGGAAYVVPENIGNQAINTAMQGCGLYPEKN